ncbi:MAG: radical SAM protein [DPANN group archaeon]|nr:radical SAM protein [DPANN group archaeon]
MKIAVQEHETILARVKQEHAFTKTRINGLDYVINPYVGCHSGCRYCYAAYTKACHHATEEWGSFVDVKKDFVQKLERELEKTAPGKVLVSGLTDPYQPIELKEKIVRRCIKLLKDHGCTISILTKSHNVIRDLDLLDETDEVGLSIAFHDDTYTRIFEPNAASIEKRFAAMETVLEKGLKANAMVSPILPLFTNLERLISRLNEVQPSYAYFDTVIARSTWPMFEQTVEEFFPEKKTRVKELLKNSEYKLSLRRMIEQNLSTSIPRKVLF